MPDLLILKACEIPAWEELSQISYEFPACRRVATAFTSNIVRAHAILMLPGYCFMGGKNWQSCIANATDRIFGGRTPTEKEFNAKSSDVSTLATSMRAKALAERDARSAREEFIIATHNAEVFASEIRNARVMIHDVLRSSVTQAWTAYEVLADDLWHRVNAKHPALRSAWTKKEKGESGFLSRSKIANAYRYTFRHDNAEILAVVDDPAVHALAVARNVIVHSAGRIDLIFQKDRKNIASLSRIRGKKIGYEIQFTGDLVRFLVDPVIRQGFRLVKAVDQWLMRHP